MLLLASASALRFKRVLASRWGWGGGGDPVGRWLDSVSIFNLSFVMGAYAKGGWLNGTSNVADCMDWHLSF